VGGLYSAARDGGDILTGVVVGGAAGAATGYLGEYLVTALPDGGWSVNAGRWAVEGAGQGIAAGYAGGRGNLQSILLASAVAAATSVALQSAYYGLVDYDATLLPGGPTVPKDALGVPQQGTNNVLFATATPSACAELDYDRSVKTFHETHRRAEEGDQGAAARVAYFYQVGIGTERDPEKAVYWYERAGERGWFWLGTMYAEGRDVPRDPD